MDIPVNSEGNDDRMDPAMEQDEPGHAEPSSEQMHGRNDPEGRVHQAAPGQEHSPDDDAFIIPETAWNEITSTEGIWPQQEA